MDGNAFTGALQAADLPTGDSPPRAVCVKKRSRLAALNNFLWPC